MNPHNILQRMLEVDYQIPDPGTGTKIAPDKHGTMCIVTGGSGETNKLMPPVKLGQKLTLSMKTDGGGARVITARNAADSGSVAITADPYNTITLDDAGDSIDLDAIDIGGTLRWWVAANRGSTLSNV